MTTAAKTAKLNEIVTTSELIGARLVKLVEDASSYGLIITVTTKSLEPFAMGQTISVAEVRMSREMYRELERL